MRRTDVTVVSPKVFAEMVAGRLHDIWDHARSGATEMTGRAIVAEGDNAEFRGQVIGRHKGGSEKLYPELVRAGLSPGEAAKSIEGKRKGKRYRRLVSAVAVELGKQVTVRKVYERRKDVPGHWPVTKKCHSCGVAHSTSAHRFHGQGAFHSTHAFSFGRNPTMRKKGPSRKGASSSFGRIVAAKSHPFQESSIRKQKKRISRMRKPIPKSRYQKPDPFGDSFKLFNVKRRRNPGDDSHTSTSTEVRSPTRTSTSTKALTAGNITVTGGAGRGATTKVIVRRNPPGAVKIYGRVLRIEAQKTGKHRCDAQCKKAGHRYYHVFRLAPTMFGLPDGSLLIKG